MRFILRVLILFGIAYLGLVALLFYRPVQRKLLYFPTHNSDRSLMDPWVYEGRTIGVARVKEKPENVWLMIHGNGGQASDRDLTLSAFSKQDSVYVMEYPGYGLRPGSPSKSSLNAAAVEAYRLLRERHRMSPVCVVGESIGCGPSCYLATLPVPPDKLVLITPFDELGRVAAGVFPFLPARWLLRDNWNNVENVKNYPGPVEIFAARDDQIIPPQHAERLAASREGIVIHHISGGHNDWNFGEVHIRNR